jgi:D-lactate dehydrogenase
LKHTKQYKLTYSLQIQQVQYTVRKSQILCAGLSGMDMHGKTVGVLGTGRIGRVFINIMLGFGCRVLACDPYPAEEVKKVSAPSDVVGGGGGGDAFYHNFINLNPKRQMLAN